ncbi:hypothetical protein Tco_0012436 [Tanacetum coccineum]
MTTILKQDQGGVSDEILLSRMELTKQMQDIKSTVVRDQMQKAKIQWAVEGDENSKFFHGIVNHVQNRISPNRQILEWPFIINELLSLCRQKSRQAMVYKVDFCPKLTTPIRWDYLDDVLFSFGFSVKWPLDKKEFKLSNGFCSLLMEVLLRNFNFIAVMKQGNPLAPYPSSFLFSLHGFFFQTRSFFSISSNMLSIIREVSALKHQGIDFLSHCKRRVGSGECETQQLENIQDLVRSKVLSNVDDRWAWDLNGDGDFVCKELETRVRGKYVRSGCTTALNVVPWETDGESVLREAMTNTQTPPHATTVVIPTGAPATNTVANHAERPEKFNGQNFKRWQQKMFFYLTTLGLARFLKETVPQVEPPAEGQSSNAQAVQAVEAWKHSDFLCHNYVLNGLIDPLYNVYCKTGTAQRNFGSIRSKYKKQRMLHKRKEMSVEDLVVRLRIEEDNKLAQKDTYAPDSAKANMVEHAGSSSRSNSKGKGKDKKKNDKKGKGKSEYLAPKAGIVKQKF